MSREQKYAEAIDYLISDHSMWIDGKGRPLEYTPQREARIADFVYQAAGAVMAVADAEQAELRAEVERLRGMWQSDQRMIEAFKQAAAEWQARAYCTGPCAPLCYRPTGGQP